MSVECRYRRGNDNRETPRWLLESLFRGWFDPCPVGGTGGLTCEWVGDRVYVNPPYSNPKPWVERAIRECRQNGKTVALLLKHDSSTEWWRLLHEAGAHFFAALDRLKFGEEKPAPFPSVLALLTPEDE